jgi:hypothetical protein
MPGLNQTGPMGQGPMTGRRMGRCTDFGAVAKNDNNEASEKQTERQSGQFPRRDFGFGRRRGGRGRGMGRQNRFMGGF